MNRRVVNGITLFFDASETDTADLFADACTASARLIGESWALEAPADCRVYVMTSWLRFYFHSAPWPERIMYGAALPLWYSRARRLWPFIAGWTQAYRNRPAVGVKPPHLVKVSDRSVGQRMLVEDDDLNRKVRCAICHELTHAFSAHLKLPLWLNEGVAMVTVDRFVGKQTVKPETIEALASHQPKKKPARPRQLYGMEHDSLAYQYIRAYWITRYLEDVHPGLVKGLLWRRQPARSHERRLAEALGISPGLLWRQIDGLVAAHFDAAMR